MKFLRFLCNFLLFVALCLSISLVQIGIYDISAAAQSEDIDGIHIVAPHDNAVSYLDEFTFWGTDIKVGLKNEPKYRRVRLSEYLKKKYGDRYLCIDPLKDIFKIPKLGSNNIIIFSRPILKQNMLTLLKKGNKLIYERTDNWKVCSDTYDERDLQHVNSVDIVTNSARYLYEESKKYNENSYFIPNGCKEYNYVDYDIQKYETKNSHKYV